MDPVRFGLAIRALRHRRGWTQQELARRARMSRSAVSRVERGQGDSLSVRTLVHLCAALAARVSVRVLWQGEELDRLLDGDHARLVEWVVERLSAAGWVVVPEATFHVGGERESIDVLAWHPATGHLLVVEVKSVVPDIQATLSGVDRKARVAPVVARGRGWTVRSVSRILVLPDDRTARRRVDQFAATFARAFPERTVTIRRWIDAPDRAVAGVMFVSGATQAGTRHRVRTASRPATLDPAPDP
jgi:HTH-type transcriptional regulator/antitoxin HipB